MSPSWKNDRELVIQREALQAATSELRRASKQLQNQNFFRELIKKGASKPAVKPDLEPIGLDEPLTYRPEVEPDVMTRYIILGRWKFFTLMGKAIHVLFEGYTTMSLYRSQEDKSRKAERGLK